MCVGVYVQVCSESVSMPSIGSAFTSLCPNPFLMLTANYTVLKELLMRIAGNRVQLIFSLNVGCCLQAQLPQT